MSHELGREHYRAMIFYDFKVGLSEDTCIQRLHSAFSDEAPSRATVFRWFREFRRGRSSLHDEEHTARPCSAVTPENVCRVRKMITDDNRCTYQMIEAALGIGSPAVYEILHEELKVRKIVSRWIPHQLTEEQKAERVRISKQTLKLLKDGEHRIISKIVTGDKTYIPFYDVPTCQESRVWVFDGESAPTTVKRQRTMKKVMYAVFFRSTGLVKAIKLEEQKTVTASWYTQHCLSEVLQDLKIKSLMLHHDNASLHSAAITVNFLRENHIKVIEHPEYSADLAVCDFWLFFNLKKHLRGQRFSSEQGIDIAISAYFDSIPAEEWRNAFHLWKIRLQKCIDAGGDYFEKHVKFGVSIFYRFLISQ